MLPGQRRYVVDTSYKFNTSTTPYLTCSLLSLSAGEDMALIDTPTNKTHGRNPTLLSSSGTMNNRDGRERETRLSEKTLKVGGPYYLVSMPGEVKDPTQRVNV